MPETVRDDFTSAELRAMAAIALRLEVDSPDEQELMLRTIRFLSQLTDTDTDVIFAVCECLRPFPHERQMVMLSRLLSGEPLLGEAKQTRSHLRVVTE